MMDDFGVFVAYDFLMSEHPNTKLRGSLLIAGYSQVVVNRLAPSTPLLRPYDPHLYLDLTN